VGMDRKRGLTLSSRPSRRDPLVATLSSLTLSSPARAERQPARAQREKARAYLTRKREENCWMSPFTPPLYPLTVQCSSGGLGRLATMSFM
jgi:hypothetical protein